MAASLHFNRAGEIAEAAAHGPGSFQTEFLDALWNVTAEQIAESTILAMAASLHFNRAGEIAEAAAHGPGSFQTEFLDALWNVTAEQIAESTILQ